LVVLSYVLHAHTVCQYNGDLLQGQTSLSQLFHESMDHKYPYALLPFIARISLH